MMSENYKTLLKEVKNKQMKAHCMFTDQIRRLNTVKSNMQIHAISIKIPMIFLQKQKSPFQNSYGILRIPNIKNNLKKEQNQKTQTS